MENSIKRQNKSKSLNKKNSNNKLKRNVKNESTAKREKYNVDELIFALDIGTHSVIGMVGIKRETRVEVIEIAEKSYPVRAMVDGQIQDIDMVSRTSSEVKERLEKSLNIELKNVFVAAAGRTLKTVENKYVHILDEPMFLDDDLITRINSMAIEEAEQVFKSSLNSGENGTDEYYLSGYSISEYVLDGYPMPTLKEHHGKVIEAKAIVTFLPREVVESLYTATGKIGLDVSGLTLEPIAAMNAVIPSSIRLLNLALVDIGAGTSDIAVSRDGSVVGYTMVTVAGDEITEAIMKKFLVDFEVAEDLKLKMGDLEEDEVISYRDILYMDHTITLGELKNSISDAATDLAKKISDAIIGINKTLPSAVFLVGGGSKLSGFAETLAKTMGMDKARVALGGNNFEKTAFSKKYDIKIPSYATCLGIAVSAGFDASKEGFFIKLNGKKCRLFRTGSISVFDILLMNGYSHKDLFARRGESVTVNYNGQKKTFFGEPSEPAIINVNGEEARPTTILKVSDNINFIPARQGKPAKAFLRDLIGDFKTDCFNVYVNNTEYLAGSFICLDSRNITNEEELNIELYNNCNISVQKIFNLDELSKYYGIKGRLYIDGRNDDRLYADCIIVREEMPNIEEKPQEVKEPEKPIEEVNGVSNTKIDVKNVYDAGENTYSTPLAKIEVQRIPVGMPDVVPIDSNTRMIKFFLNGSELLLPEKKEGKPYILSDMLIHTGFDFKNIRGSFITLVNGAEASFTTPLKSSDRITISIEE